MEDATEEYTDWWEKQAETVVLRYGWAEAHIPFTDFTGSNYSHILNAQYAWQGGLSIFTAQFRIWNELSTVVNFAGTLSLHEHWNHTLSSIVKIGWRLHTWTPEVDGSFYRAFAVFERPS